jgi:hypothetical protein
MDYDRLKCTKTFVLGAGFSAAQEFPLVAVLKNRVLHFMQAEQHPSYRVFLQSGNGGFERGQFFAGLDLIDPRDSLGFEELLIALTRHTANTSPIDPCHVTLKQLRSGCGRLFWYFDSLAQNPLACHKNFATWLRSSPESLSHGIISFNWDLLAERALARAKIPWAYSDEEGSSVPILKPHGSINWSRHLQEELKAEYQDWLPISLDSKFCFDYKNPFLNPDIDNIHPNLRYMIFPGDPELPIHDSDALRIWTQIHNILGKSDLIVFIGYSLPSYDSYALQCFKKACKGKIVEVYNPSTEHLQRFQAELSPHVRMISVVAEKFENCIYAQQK